MAKTAYSVKELSEQLGISLLRAYELCNDPNFPAVRISPRRIIIPVDCLNRWLEEQATREVI